MEMSILILLERDVNYIHMFNESGLDFKLQTLVFDQSWWRWETRQRHWRVRTLRLRVPLRVHMSTDCAVLLKDQPERHCVKELQAVQWSIGSLLWRSPQKQWWVYMRYQSIRVHTVPKNITSQRLREYKVKKMRSPACCRQENAFFSPHIHTTNGK